MRLSTHHLKMFKPFILENKVRIVFFFALLFIVCLGFFTFKSTQLLISTTEKEIHSLKVIATLENVVSMVKDAQSSVQGYVITGRSHTLSGYNAALNVIPKEMESLIELTESNEEQSKRVTVLSQLIDAQLTEMRRIVRLKKIRGTRAASYQIRTDRSKDLMDKIKVLATATVEEKSTLLTNRPEEVRFAVKLTNFVLPMSFLLVLIASFIVQRHIQKQKKTEDELVKAREQALNASHFKSAFLANMSHEIRTPMNGIVGVTELLQETELDDNQKKFTELIRLSANNLLKIINAILDVSKIEAGKIELEVAKFSLYDLVEKRMEILSVQAAEKGVQLNSILSPSMPKYLMGDSVRIDQILTNLMGNAIKFTNEGGHVSLRVELVESHMACVVLKFEIVDDGIGLDQEEISKLFRPFSQADNSTTRKYGGTGLGLSICRNLVDLMAGTIGVESEKGRGSRFWFMITLATYQQSIQNSTTSLQLKETLQNWDNQTLYTDTSCKVGKKVLVAEDNSINQVIISKQLESLGYKVTAVANGKEAIELLEAESFDLILMDCQMPEMDGYQTTKEIRRREECGSRRTPIVALTANAMQGDADVCFEAGMDDYLSKPVKKTDLAKTIAHWCET